MTRKSLVPMVVSLGAFLVLGALLPGWYYSSVGWVDAWGYFGEMVDPVGMRLGMPTYPTGDLLSLIWPAALLYKFLPAVEANFLIKLLTFMAIASLFYFALKKETDSRTALSGTALFILSKYFLMSIGSDYTDGRVVLYQTAALFFISRVSRNENQRSVALNLFGAGFSFALSVISALLSVTLGLPLLIYYLARCPKSFSIRGVGMVLLGFLSAFVVLGLVHMTYAGTPIFFLATIEKMFFFLGMNRIHYFVPLWKMPWLYLPLFPIVIALARESKTKFTLDSPTLLYAAMAAAAILPFIYLQIFRAQETVSNYCYFNQSTPFSFFAISCLCFPPIFRHEKTKASAKRLVGFGLTLCLLSLLLTYHSINPYFPRMTACCIGVAVSLAFLSRKFAATVLAFGLVIVLNLYPVVPEYFKAKNGVSDYSRNPKQVLKATASWIKIVQQIDPGRQAYLWYDKSGDFAFMAGFSAASHLWQARILNEYLPLLNVPMGEQGIVRLSILGGRPLIMLNTSDEQFAAGIRAIEADKYRAKCEAPLPLPLNRDHTLLVRKCDVQANSLVTP